MSIESSSPPEKEKAAAKARKNKSETRAPSGTRLLHELRVHQIELETQNDALREARDELEASRDRFADFYELSPVGFLTLCNNGLIADVNRTGAAMLGAEQDGLLSQPFARFLKPADAVRWHLHLADALKTGDRLNCELGLQHADGSQVHVRLDSLRVNHDGQSPALRVVLTDISERKQHESVQYAAKTAAESASLAKSHFLAAASHDLRQPLQALNLFVDALGRTSLNEDQKDISRYLSESTQSLGEILNTLLDISRLDSGAVQSKPETIQVHALFDRINAEFSPLATAKSLRFKLNFPFGDMAVLTDAKLLMRLLGNLIGNAIKYTQHGGVMVSLRRREGRALIQVWDTGRGITPKDLDRIFDEYFQIGNAERDRTKGLGLGLSIAKRIAKLLDTEVVCRSRPNKGSVFEFFLPLPSLKDVQTSCLFEPSKKLRKQTVRHIVLLEDYLMVRTATKLALESCGMTVSEYKTAEEALSDSEIANADFYISDLRLPGMNGDKFLDAVQQKRTKPIKAIIVTGDITLNREELLRSISWQILFKPVNLHSILAAIERQESGNQVFQADHSGATDTSHLGSE